MRLIAPLLAGLLALGACSDEETATEPSGSQLDVSGTYFTTMGSSRNYTLVLDQTDADVAWTLTGEGDTFTGSGTATGGAVTLTMADPFPFAADLLFADATAFTGTWEVVAATPEESSDGSITGSKSHWPTRDYALDVPRFVDTDYIELAKIDGISLFRSSAGHDFSDDFESCRSMKHYFAPEPAIDPTTIVITSPVDGVVTGYINEGPRGTQIGIASSAYEEIVFIIFHIDLSDPLTPGTTVTRGQVLGRHVGGTQSDVAVGIVTTSGWRLVSWLDVMTDGLFQDYQARDMTTRSEGIISAAARDADPLTCDGQAFTDTGTLPSYFDLN